MGKIYKIILSVITVLNGVVLYTFSYYYKPDLKGYLYYVVIAHTCSYIILGFRKRTTFWWIILAVNALITVWSIVSCIIYFRMQALGH